MKVLKITCTGMERLELDNTLAALQEQVEGYIEVFHFGRKDARGICNENGIAMGLPLNLLATLMTDITIRGTVLIVGIDPDDPFAEDFCDCPEDLLAIADEYATKEKDRPTDAGTVTE
ncbi:MAG: DUF3846 domain-containing protein [Ruminococcus sp.]|nr:DUF3846 domain-containing protein [Ruminococcus sp.]